jgi:hypothetical protein
MGSDWTENWTEFSGGWWTRRVVSINTIARTYIQLTPSRLFPKTGMLTTYDKVSAQEAANLCLFETKFNANQGRKTTTWIFGRMARIIYIRVSASLRFNPRCRAGCYSNFYCGNRTLTSVEQANKKRVVIDQMWKQIESDALGRWSFEQPGRESKLRPVPMFFCRAWNPRTQTSYKLRSSINYVAHPECSLV